MTTNPEHTTSPEPEESREAMEAELARLRALEAAELSTRDRSPVKPQDHKPAADEVKTVEFGGVTFKAARNAFNKLATLDLLERGMINTAIRRVVGDETYTEFLEKNPDADEETAGKLLEALIDQVGAKN